ncbi:hypothetical protein cypCar_00002581 [Cyprinus carpio]|nr:hypothetical protein cypCar_00002581 [Cyprinus carpio]
MAEPRFNNPYFWPPPPSMPGQLDNLVLIDKIKEQLMAEKIRPPHLPPTTVPSQQTLLLASSPSDGGQHVMSIPKLQQVPGLQAHNSSQPDIALHARPASSTIAELNIDDKSTVKAKGLWEDWHMRQALDQVSRANHRTAGLTLSSRTESHNTSEAITPTTPTSSSQNRMGGTPSLNTISGLASGPGMEHVKSGGLVGMLGPQPRAPRGRKKIKAENNTGPLLVLPYPLLASGPDQAVTIAKEGKTYRFNTFSNDAYHSHQRQHNKDKPYKCPNCYRAYTDSASLQIHLSAHAIKNAKSYCCSMCGRAYTSETYLMKHMSKHTVVEHLVSHHSPQRTESPSIPIRISLI